MKYISDKFVVANDTETEAAQFLGPKTLDCLVSLKCTLVAPLLNTIQFLIFLGMDEGFDTTW